MVSATFYCWLKCTVLNPTLAEKPCNDFFHGLVQFTDSAYVPPVSLEPTEVPLLCPGMISQSIAGYGVTKGAAK